MLNHNQYENIALMKTFYTYLHCKPDLKPFYVGKGYGDRAYRFNGRNQHHKRIVDKCGGQSNIVVMIFKKDSEESAFASEIRLIRMLRKAGFELANHTDGGEGLSNPSDETRAKIGAAHKGNKYGVGNKGMRGKKHTAEAKEKIGNASKGNKHNLGKKNSLGHKHSPESIAKMSAAKIGNKYKLGNRKALINAMLHTN